MEARALTRHEKASVKSFPSWVYAGVIQKVTVPELEILFLCLAGGLIASWVPLADLKTHFLLCLCCLGGKCQMNGVDIFLHLFFALNRCGKVSWKRSKWWSFGRGISLCEDGTPLISCFGWIHPGWIHFNFWLFFVQRPWVLFWNGISVRAFGWL